MLLKILTFILVVYCIYSVLKRVLHLVLIKFSRGMMQQHFEETNPKKKKGMHIDHTQKSEKKINDIDAETIDFEELE